MKKLITLIIGICIYANCYAWKPIFAGHRGGYTGVQNTAEAYRNGVDKYGYSGLECDVRVTSDGKYVIMHDETTNSLGGNLAVANATLEELKAEDLKQTRGGVEYTGKICTVEEYLQICKEKNVFPLVELKYTTGINSNSMSNFPGLMKLITDAGLSSKVVFLTSMKTSLEYIRTNYPDVKCQFLTNANWKDHFDWCVKWGINPSIQSGTFDQNTVVQFHQKGLDVAVWTVNDAANYKNIGSWGVYMMTCDYLYPSQMEELADVDWDSFPEVLDPLEITIETLWERSEKSNNLPTNFPSKLGTTYKTGQQAAIVDGKFYVNNYDTSTLLSFDKDSESVTEVPTESNFGGSAAIGITSDDAGNIIQRCESAVSIAPSSLKLVKKGDNKGTLIDFTLSNTGQANFVFASGDVFSDDGGYVYLFPSGKSVISILNICNGALKSIVEANGLSIAASTAGVIIPMGESFDKFIYQKRDVGYYLFNKVNKGNYLNGSASTQSPARNSSLGGAFFKLNGHDILVHPSGTNYCGGLTVRDMSASAKVIGVIEAIGTSAYSANASTGTFAKAVKIDENDFIVYSYTMGIGYGAYEIKVKGGSTPALKVETNNLKIYPNPAESILNIEYSEPINDIKIISTLGNTALSIKADATTKYTTNIEFLPTGIYCVQVNNSTIKVFIKK